ncbi:TatD family hydrolase [Verrucomicrobiota bacterium]
MKKLFDAHCHIQDERLFPHFEDMLEKASAAGVEFMATKGCTEIDWVRLKRFADAYDFIYPSYGLHPCWIDKRTGNWKEELCRYLIENPAAGVGEIGLDHKMDAFDPDDQEQVFRDQLVIAKELNRPVTIHCRNAWGQLVEILKEFGPFERGAVIHCYGGSAATIKELLPLNAYISFAGAILRPTNKKAAQIVPTVPADRLLIETDAPDLFPDISIDEVEKLKPFRHDEQNLNEPATLPYVLQRVAKLRNESEEVIARQTYENAQKIFGFNR